MWPRAQERLQPRELEEAARTLPGGLWREPGPGDTLISDFRPWDSERLRSLPSRLL